MMAGGEHTAQAFVWFRRSARISCL